MTPEQKQIEEISDKILALQRQLYALPLRNRRLKRTVSFCSNTELADSIAIAAATAGMSRSEWLRNLVGEAINKIKKVESLPVNKDSKTTTTSTELLEF